MDQFVEPPRAAQRGHGMENLARVYGLSAQQAKAVADALMPAFADGFRHTTQSPEAMASLMALMLSGPYGAYYGQPGAYAAPQPAPAAPPPPQQADMNQLGVDALNAVFGSDEVSRAVAGHVAASTGLGIAIVRQMMPTFASLFVGGLAKSLAASGALQTMTAALLSRLPLGLPQTRPAPISSGNPWIDAFLAFSATTASQPTYSSGNPWADAFARAMFQHGAPPAPAQPRANPASAWQDVVSAMANTLAQTGAPAQNPAAPPPPPPPVPPMPAQGDALLNPLQPFQEFFAKMFAQGFPPNFPTGGAERQPYSVPEFWLDVLSRARQAVPEAEILPPEKPRLVKKDGEGR
ncbi:DUF937 domain-containing protein [Xanthobacter sediminis]|uniref:DUF937 domain-containing protein n=1 Tax=Xanthobacter sediminis TaxID=3119926 RepID=UPI00372AF8D9